MEMKEHMKEQAQFSFHNTVNQVTPLKPTSYTGVSEKRTSSIVWKLLRPPMESNHSKCRQLISQRLIQKAQDWKEETEKKGSEFGFSQKSWKIAGKSWMEKEKKKKDSIYKKSSPPKKKLA